MSALIQKTSAPTAPFAAKNQGVEKKSSEIMSQDIALRPRTP